MKKLVEQLQDEIDSLKASISSLNNDDVVGINVTWALIGEKENMIERLNKLV